MIVNRWIRMVRGVWIMGSSWRCHFIYRGWQMTTTCGVPSPTLTRMAMVSLNQRSWRSRLPRMALQLIPWMSLMIFCKRLIPTRWTSPSLSNFSITKPTLMVVILSVEVIHINSGLKSALNIYRFFSLLIKQKFKFPIIMCSV